MEITKIKQTCISCEKSYIIAYEEPSELPEFCAFCGDVVIPTGSDELEGELDEGSGD